MYDIFIFYFNTKNNNLFEKRKFIFKNVIMFFFLFELFYISFYHIVEDKYLHDFSSKILFPTY